MKTYLLSCLLILSYSISLAQIVSEEEFADEAESIEFESELEEKKSREQKLTKKQVKKLKLYPKESELNTYTTEVDEILRAQFVEQFNFSIEAMYLGNNLYYIPLIVLTTKKKESMERLYEIQLELHEFLRKHNRKETSIKSIVYYKERPYGMMTSKTSKDTCYVYDLEPMLTHLEAQLDTLEDVAIGEFSYIRAHKIKEVYWHAAPYLFKHKAPFTLAIISEDAAGKTHYSRMDKAFGRWRIDYFGPAPKRNYGYDYITSRGALKRPQAGVPLTTQHYIHTYRGNFIFADEQYSKLNLRTYSDVFYLRIK
ncbi:MAG: hypothetical protein R8P61_17190 [Bacteroidia bacterium]|nr:hypothetical protein [Bacteroidia bacterium]